MQHVDVALPGGLLQCSVAAVVISCKSGAVDPKSFLLWPSPFNHINAYSKDRILRTAYQDSGPMERLDALTWYPKLFPERHDVETT